LVSELELDDMRAPQQDEAHEPLIGHDGVGTTAQDAPDSPLYDGSSTGELHLAKSLRDAAPPAHAPWLLTLTACLSGLLFGYEYATNPLVLICAARMTVWLTRPLVPASYPAPSFP